MKHHYVPQFYQRGFIKEVNKDGKKEGLIWVYEKGRPPRKLPVSNTGMEIDLYAYTDQSGNQDNQTIEAELGRIDNSAALVIQKLDKETPITDDERRSLCKFISVMYRRTPKFKEHAKRMAAELMPKFFEQHDEEWLRQEMRKRARSEEQAEAWFEYRKAELAEMREEYLREPPEFIFTSNILRPSVFERVLFDMDWAYFKAAADTEFVTCDDPALFSKGSGLGDRENAVVMFPMSRTLLLQAMWNSSYKGAYVQLRDVDVRKFNRDVVINASRQVYASYASNTFASFVTKRIDTV
jgi:hypothetical protein